MAPLRPSLLLIAALGLGGCPTEQEPPPPPDLSGLDERLDELGAKLGTHGDKLSALEQKLDELAAKREAEPPAPDGGGGSSPDLRDPFADDVDRPPRKSVRDIPGAADAIECHDDTDPPHCTIERSFVEELVANPAMLAKQARVVPSMEDGKTNGYKLYAIRKGTLFDLLQLQNGDRIKAVNGEDLTSIDKAMALYTKIRRASSLTIDFVRHGTDQTIELRIVE